MRYILERRSKIRKAFRRSFLFEQMATELNRKKNIQRNGVCLDISEDGLGLTAGCALKKGEVVKLFIPVSKKNTTLPVFAEVRWARSTNDNFRTGLRFLQ
jgi:hypothetical protein